MDAHYRACRRLRSSIVTTDGSVFRGLLDGGENLNESALTEYLVSTGEDFQSFLESTTWSWWTKRS